MLPDIHIWFVIDSRDPIVKGCRNITERSIPHRSHSEINSPNQGAICGHNDYRRETPVITAHTTPPTVTAMLLAIAVNPRNLYMVPIQSRTALMRATIVPIEG